MKKLCTLCLITLSLVGLCQRKINVTIIGTVHYFSPENQVLQDFNSAEAFIIRSNPDIICIESIPVEDTASLRAIWPTKMKQAASLKDSLKQHEAYPYPSSSPQDQSNSFWRTYGSKAKVLRGASYFADNDYWNAFYYWFQAEKAGDSLHYFSKFQRNLSNSEYGLFVYPAAQKLSIDQLYSIDYRAGEAAFLSNTNKVLKKLLFRLKWKPLSVYIKTQKRYKKAEKKGTLIEYINGDEFQRSFSLLIDELPQKLPKSEEAHQVTSYWLERNRIMADRIIQRAEEQSAETVLLAVGSAHVTHIKKFLEEKGHQVVTYGDFLQTQNK